MKPYKIYDDGVEIEQGALDQFYSAMEQDFVVRGALMPDAHQGYSLPIGAVVATKDYVLPSWVGYDIGCGMCALPTTFSALQVASLQEYIMNSIYEAVPVGFNHNKFGVNPNQVMPEPTKHMKEIFKAKGGYKQLGTLGGGNHFIEVGTDADGKVWIVIHSGSRGIGHGCATHYMKLASPDGKAREGHYGWHLSDSNAQDYMQDQEFCLQFALVNRKTIMRRTIGAIQRHVDGLGIWESLINRNHNHAEQRGDLLIHRKGATHAEEGMKGVIPGNMSAGSYIVTGLGNEEALWSSSHGAGRVLGRKEAKRVLLLEDFENEMLGISARVEQDCLDEAPLAYKDIDEVMHAQQDLVRIDAYIAPLVNVKG
jgi:tRNA-splicing ligase RtcB